MPAAGRKLSQASKYSCVAPGPPCNSSNLIRGLLPMRLVQTLNFPLGVWTSMIFTPPLKTSARPVLSRYPAGVVGSAAGHACADSEQTMTATRATCLSGGRGTFRPFMIRFLPSPLAGEGNERFWNLGDPELCGAGSACPSRDRLTNGEA